MGLVAQHLKTCAVCASEYRFEGNVLDEVREKLRHHTVTARYRVRSTAAGTS